MIVNDADDYGNDNDNDNHDDPPQYSISQRLFGEAVLGLSQVQPVTHQALSCLIISCSILSYCHIVISCHILSYLITLSYFHILSFLKDMYTIFNHYSSVSDHISSHLITSHHISSNLIISQHISSYPGLSVRPASPSEALAHVDPKGSRAFHPNADLP